MAKQGEVLEKLGLVTQWIRKLKRSLDQLLVRYLAGKGQNTFVATKLGKHPLQKTRRNRSSCSFQSHLASVAGKDVAIRYLPTVLRGLLPFPVILHLHSVRLIKVFLRGGGDIWQVFQQLFSR